MIYGVTKRTWLTWCGRYARMMMMMLFVRMMVMRSAGARWCARMMAVRTR